MDNWIQGICNEKSGFLFSHPCDRVSSEVCANCAKPICREHAHQGVSGKICTSCKKKQWQRSNTSRLGYLDNDNDPYFYGAHYYQDYGDYRQGRWGHHDHPLSNQHDPHDFTEADAERLEPGDGDFESDLTES